MVRLADRRESFCILISLLFLVANASNTAAERLPIKNYTTADGLAHSRVGSIVLDSRGFLWFCTGDGLSRFDGSRFTNYNLEDGLPNSSINSFLETRDGVYWVATNGGGVARLNSTTGFRSGSRPKTQLRFTAYQMSNEAVTNRVNMLLQDQTGILWAATDGGLFRLDVRNGEREFQRADLQIPSHSDLSIQVWALVEASDGTLWIGTKFGLVHRSQNGRMIHYEIDPAKTGDSVWSILKDSENSLWLTHDTGVIVFKPESELEAQAEPGRSLKLQVGRRYSTASAPEIHPRRLFQSSNGRIWVSDTGPGLSAFDGKAFQPQPVKEFLDGAPAIGEDRDGNLWLGTQASGALRLAMNGFSTFDSRDGLGQFVGSVFEGHEGELYVTGKWQISRFDGEKFLTVNLNLPRPVTDTDWRPAANVIQDRAGEWWVGTRVGLYRFPKVSRFEDLGTMRPKAVYTRNDGLADDDVTLVFEDSRGDLWIGGFSTGREVLTRWERASGSFHRYSEADGLRPFSRPNVFCEDRAGNLWIGFEGGLARYRGGQFNILDESVGLPPGPIMGLYVDQLGRLWFSDTGAGILFRIDDTQATHPQLIAYTRDDGLNIHRLRNVTGDLAGRIYVGNSLGLDQLDVSTRHIRHYASSDGAGPGDLQSAFRDRLGNLWFVTAKGLLRLVPQSMTQTGPPTIAINGLRVAGSEYQLSDFGETEISGLEIEPNQNRIQIDFFGLGFGAGESLRYQYILEGSFSDWSPPSNERSVNFANLGPGSYRFFVRAISANGLTSEGTAAVEFKILFPIWRRWWFLGLTAVIGSALVIVFARSRIARARAVSESEKRFRTLAETASDAIITIDEDSRIIYVNAAAQKVFGYTEQEMMGTELTMLMPEYLRHLHREGFSRYRRTGERHISWRAVELPGLHKTGSEIPLELSFGEFTKDEKRLFTGIVRDITERKQAEEERKHAEQELRRSREERLAELERVRQRIATDLHDDIGSSLTQIAILSEIAHQNVRAETSQHLEEPLARITDVSNELVETMSDIVWAINPRKDHLSDLVQRMRRFASDIFTSRKISFRFDAMDPGADFELGVNLRREVFLIFKETVNNIVKHSRCTRAEIQFQIEAGWLILKMADDGTGFDCEPYGDNVSAVTSSASGGNGIPSMRRRAREIGGRFEIVSARGQGTTATLKVLVAQNRMDEATTHMGGAERQ